MGVTVDEALVRGVAEGVGEGTIKGEFVYAEAK